ncbi:MAG: GNAT family N-acetyltransferase, partial [Bacteroidales bacterium]|nr:GNAT family N-acetyltransferase [Bacteroidales bacterium]
IKIKANIAKPDDLNLFLKIEGSGWKGKAGSAISSKEHNRIFFKHLCEELTARKWMEWYFLKAEDNYIAGYMTIVFGKSCYIFKTGYNEEYHKCSPGSLLTDIMLEEIFAKKEIDEINFYSDYKWLNNWNLTEYTYYNLRIAFNTPVSLIATGIPMFIFSRLKWIRKTHAYLLKKINQYLK